MPRGLVNSKERDPATFTHAEWQQAKRGGHDPKALKEMFQECWAISDSRQAFAQALKARGYTLARGDRRGFVAMDYRGEVYAVAKFVGAKTKDVRSRLGDPDTLPDIAQAKRDIAARMTGMLQRHVREAEARLKTQSAALALRKAETVQRQRQERARLDQQQAERRSKESRERARRLPGGLQGLWNRVTGRHGRMARMNDLQALQAFQRDRAEKDRLIFAHIEERHSLHTMLKAARAKQADQVAELHRDIGQYERLRMPEQREASRKPERTPTAERGSCRSGKSKDFGHER